MRKLASMTALPARDLNKTTTDLRSYEPDLRLRDLNARVKAAEENLARAEDDLARVLQISHSFIYETDKHLRITMINGDAQEILGIPPSELIGKLSDEFLRIGDGLSSDDAEHKAFRNLVCRTQDGTRHVQISGKPLRDENGEFCGYHGVISDATALIEAEERAAALYRRFREAIECVPASLMLFRRRRSAGDLQQRLAELFSGGEGPAHPRLEFRGFVAGGYRQRLPVED